MKYDFTQGVGPVGSLPPTDKVSAVPPFLETHLPASGGWAGNLAYWKQTKNQNKLIKLCGFCFFSWVPATAGGGGVDPKDTN